MFNEWSYQEEGLSGAGGIVGTVAGLATTFLGGIFGGGAKKRAAQYQEGSEIIKQQEKELAQLDVEAQIAKSSVFYQFGKKFHKFNKQNPIIFPLVALAGIYYLANR